MPKVDPLLREKWAGAAVAGQRREFQDFLTVPDVVQAHWIGTGAACLRRERDGRRNSARRAGDEPSAHPAGEKIDISRVVVQTGDVFK